MAEQDDDDETAAAAEVFDLRDKLAAAGDDAPTGLFSLAAAKRELGLQAGEAMATAADSEAGVGVAPAEGEAPAAAAVAGGMDVDA